jgi:Schlafen group 3, DNA/RNA helicase domain
MLQRNDKVAADMCGWANQFPVFRAASLEEIVNALTNYVRDSTPEQIRAWRGSIRPLQQQCGVVVDERPTAKRYCAILEYRMPDGSKRVDAVLLLAGAVLIVEMKGDGNWQPEYREQAADYARRLFWFHRYCGEENVRVHTVLVNYGLGESDEERDFLTTTRIERLAKVMMRFDQPEVAEPLPLEKFLSEDACQPSPSLVQAVRQYFSQHALPRIKRIDDVTKKCLRRTVDEIHDTQARRKRKLLLVSGVPGAGKTYVGLQIAHDRFLDDLAEPMASGEKPTAPAVFLSGNGPLVEVLQYELKSAGGDGRVFVRGVKDFVAKYSKKRSGAPPHHVLIFDEAQRAWDAERVRAKHNDPEAASEPETFVNFAERVSGWCVVIGLIGTGQEIHAGEEGGMSLWAVAVANSKSEWEVTGPERFRAIFETKGVTYIGTDDLHLGRSVRFHFAAGLSEWAEGVIDKRLENTQLIPIARELTGQGYQLRITRNLKRAKEFLWQKYSDLPDARFGLLHSSRDKRIGDVIHVDRRRRYGWIGPWYADPESSPESCRRLTQPISEFEAQGLELDHSLLIWGTDFVLKEGKWDDSSAKKYQKSSGVRDPLRLRRNAYRVLLTRGREGVVICVPEFMRELDETFNFLVAGGCEVLS